MEGGAVAAFVQVALLALARSKIHKPVVLFVAPVAEGHVIADQAILYQAYSAQARINVEEVPVGTVPGFYIEHSDALPDESLAQTWFRDGRGYPDSKCLISAVGVGSIGGVSHVSCIG